MSKIANEIKRQIKFASRDCPPDEQRFVCRYLGTQKKFLNIKSSERDNIVREFKRKSENLTEAEVIQIFNELLADDVFEHFSFVGKFLTISRRVRTAVSLATLEEWLKITTGWAECDVLCQSLYDDKEVLTKWTEFKKAIVKFRASSNIQLRRAALVLQTKPNRSSNDPKLRRLAFETIEVLKSEKETLITKAISWLLRSLSRQNPAEVSRYLEANQSTLPKIAYRETMKKIATGKK